MLDIKVEGLGINTPHEPGYFYKTKNRNRGLWLLMCFKTPFLLQTERGLEAGAPGDFILHYPTAYLYHGPTPDMSTGFVNDWILFKGSDADTFLARLGIPYNTIIKGTNLALIEPFIKRILSEQQNTEPFYSEAVALSVLDMLIHVRRSISESEVKYNKTQFESLSKVRKTIMEQFFEKWTLADMAKLAGFSVSRFTVLYRNCFGISPTEDLLNTRILQAKNMLLYGGKSISETAAATGFSSLYYFSRMFKQKTGKTPKETKG